MPRRVAHDDVVDLTDAAAIPAELRQTGAHFAHLVARGQHAYPT
jgi:hypothetical protein